MNSKTSQQLFTFKRFTYILPSRSNQRQENWGSRSFRRRPPTRHWIVKGWGGDTRRWWEPLDSQGEGWRNTWLRRHSPPARRHLPPPRAALFPQATHSSQHSEVQTSLRSASRSQQSLHEGGNNGSHSIPHSWAFQLQHRPEDTLAWLLSARTDPPGAPVSRQGFSR